ncbi:MAG: IS5 family transposase [Glaciecola sp.]|jgi:IS5 family transposase
MISYISQKQLSIEEFEIPFQAEMRSDNRWVKLSEIVPWDSFASLYVSTMDIKKGRPGISPRIVLGALIIKHLEKLDDRGVIAAIQENIYMQFFVGMSGFNSDPVFSPSLFVDLRKRVGNDVFDKLNTELIKAVSAAAEKDHLKRTEDHSNNKEDNKPFPSN